MANLGGEVNVTTVDDRLIWAEFVRLRWLGYVRYREMIVGGLLSFVLLTGLVATLPMKLFSVVFLGLLTLMALGLSIVGTILTHHQQVNIYTDSGLFVAVHQGTGDVRHGETPEEALANLGLAIEARRADE